MPDPDVVVIGAGHNGLVCANQAGVVADDARAAGDAAVIEAAAEQVRREVMALKALSRPARRAERAAASVDRRA